VEEYALRNEHIFYLANFKYFQGKLVLVPVHDLLVREECADEGINKRMIVLEAGGITVWSVVQVDLVKGKSFKNSFGRRDRRCQQ